MDEILSGPYLLHDYKPDMITDILNRLTPDNLRLVLSKYYVFKCNIYVFDTVSFLLIRVGVVGKCFQEHCDEIEQWYGTNYHLETIPEETLQVKLKKEK